MKNDEYSSNPEYLEISAEVDDPIEMRLQSLDAKICKTEENH